MDRYHLPILAMLDVEELINFQVAAIDDDRFLLRGNI